MERFPMQKNIQRWDAAAELNQVARSTGQHTKSVVNLLIEQKYQRYQGAELAEQRTEEEGKKRAHRTTARIGPAYREHKLGPGGRRDYAYNGS